MSVRKALVKWFLFDLIQNNDLSKFYDHIHENYYSLEDDIPFWLSKAGALGLSGESLANLRMTKGQRPFIDRLKIYFTTLFYKGSFSKLSIVEEGNNAVAYVKLLNDISPKLQIYSNMMFYFQFVEENENVKILSVFATFDLLEQLLKKNILELNPTSGAKHQEILNYLKRLRDMGLVIHDKTI